MFGFRYKPGDGPPPNVKTDNKERKTDQAEAAFNVFDKDKDGFISREEFTAVSKNLTEKQADAVFAKFDENKDGRLSLDEFRKMIEKKDKRK